MAELGVNTQNVTITVDNIVAGVPAGAPSEILCLMSLGSYTQSRAKKEYKCMSSSESTVGLGSISRAPLTFELLYNENNVDGQEKLKAAFANNTGLQVVIEFDNSAGVNGTKIEAPMGVSEYDLSFPKDGKIESKFSLEFQGAATVTPAA